MSRRPDTLETVMVMLDLLRRIPRGRKVTANELHVQLREAGQERDLRTVQRQLQVLSEHFDIECDDSSKPYGYRWKEKAQGLSLPMLTDQESLLLTLAEQHLRNLLPQGLMKSMEAFFLQARTKLGPPAAGRREPEWLDKVRVVSTTQPLLPPKIRSGILDEVSQALYANRWLAITYQNAAGKKTSADVMPLGLAQQGPRLYLVCRYKGFDNERSLALHRISAASASPLGFERPLDFNLRQYDDDGRFGVSDGKRIHLRFCIDRRAGMHLLESPLSVDQEVVDHDTYYEISATVVETQQLGWWLNSFGDQVRDVKRTTVV